MADPSKQIATQNIGGVPLGGHLHRKPILLVLILLLVSWSFLRSNEFLSRHYLPSETNEIQNGTYAILEIHQQGALSVATNNSSTRDQSRISINNTTFNESAIADSGHTSDENVQKGPKIDDVEGLLKEGPERLQQKPPRNESIEWTRVTQGAYTTIVEKAKRAVLPVLDDVYTDCRLLLVPSMEKERNETRPTIKFQCGEQSALQDDACHSANVCLVVLNESIWKEQIEVAPQSLYHDILNKSVTNSIVDRSDKSSILMMVDSVDYLLKEGNFNAMMNKASYSYVSNRSLFVWIGGLNQTELNRREDEAVFEAFGTTCMTTKVTNTMHYYKPIAILAVFARQSLVRNIRSVIFLDADTAFTKYAFEKLHDLGPESYLDLSPQASLMGCQNMRGQIMMNSGIVILRNTTWNYDFSALWWYSRCGHKDQIALWLIMFATFSVSTAPFMDRTTNIDDGYGVMNGTLFDGNATTQQFAYPAELFVSYRNAFRKALRHLCSHIFQIQSSWEALANADAPEGFPRPTNVSLYNGGDLARKWRKFTAPVELPHVMVLPQTPFSHRRDDGSVFELPGLKSSKDMVGIVIHSKDTVNSCSNGRCWPYLLG